QGGMMRATVRMDEELDAAGVIDPNKREAANVRACRLAGAISRMSASYQQALLTLQRKRTGGSQHVTVKHIHQQVNVTEGGQAVVAGDKVTSRARGRRSKEEGIAFATLKRAKKELGIKSYKERGKIDGPWFWELPKKATPERER